MRPNRRLILCTLLVLLDSEPIGEFDSTKLLDFRLGTRHGIPILAQAKTPGKEMP